MSDPVLYTIIISSLTIALLIFYQSKKTNSSSRKAFTQYEAAALNRLLPIRSNYRWSVISRIKNDIKLVFEDNELDRVGYYIYSSYQTQLMQNKISVYLKNNVENTYLKVVTDGSSESMFAVSHPTEGFIGYLSFEEVIKI